MESGAKQKKTFDLYDYVGPGKSLYDVLAKTGLYDASTEAMLTSAYAVSDAFPEASQRRFSRTSIKDCFNLLTSKAAEVFSDEEKKYILDQVNYLDPYKFRFRSFEECCKYIADNHESEVAANEHAIITKTRLPGRQGYQPSDVELVNSVIVTNIVRNFENRIDAKTPEAAELDDTLAKVRHTIYSGVYHIRINNEIKRRFPDRATIYREDVEEMLFADRTLSSPAKIREYDRYLKSYNDRVKAYMEKEAESVRCGAKRDKVIISELSKTMSAPDRRKANINGLESVIFGTPPRQKPAREGTFSWGLRERKEPLVVLDTFAEYSKGGVENQRVVAVSYGKFGYGTMFNNDGRPTIASEALDLVGVTRLGKDGVHTYFILVPFSDIKFKRADEIVPGIDDERVLKVNGRRTTIMDSATVDRLENLEKMGIGKHSPHYKSVARSGMLHMVYTEKIPEEQVDFFSKVAFSDRLLSTAVEDNYRFLGGVHETDKGFVMDSSYTRNAYDVEAAKYALEHRGYVGQKRYTTFDAYCKSTELMSKHLGLVRDITNGTYEFNKNKRDDGAR